MVYKTFTELRSLIDKNSTQSYVNTDEELYSLLCNPDLYNLAYLCLKDKNKEHSLYKKVFTEGLDGKSVDSKGFHLSCTESKPGSLNTFLKTPSLKEGKNKDSVLCLKLSDKKEKERNLQGKISVCSDKNALNNLIEEVCKSMQSNSFFFTFKKPERRQKLNLHKYKKSYLKPLSLQNKKGFWTDKNYQFLQTPDEKRFIKEKTVKRGKGKSLYSSYRSNERNPLVYFVQYPKEKTRGGFAQSNETEYFKNIETQIPAEEIVQEVIYLLLNIIWDNPRNPIFVEESHGFRRNRNPHTALQYIEKNFSNVNLFTQGNLKKSYDSLPTDNLLCVLEKRISPGKFLQLIKKGLKSKTLLIRDNVCQQLLSNIYFHFFDKYVLEEIKLLCKNTECFYLRHANSWILGKGQNSKAEEACKIEKKIEQFLENTLQCNLQEMEIKRNCVFNEKSKKGFLFLFYNVFKSLHKKKPCKNPVNPEFGEKINVLALNQTADESKSNGSEKVSENLSVYIEQKVSCTPLLQCSGNKKVLLKPEIKRKKRNTTDMAGWDGWLGGLGGASPNQPSPPNPPLIKPTKKTRFTLPFSLILQKLSKNGFCDQKGFPSSKENWTSKEDFLIVFSFNKILQALFSYYSGVDSRYTLNKIRYILRFSCCMTLAHKHKQSVSSLFKKYGHNLSVRKDRRTCSLDCSKSSLKKTWKKKTVSLKDPISVIEGCNPPLLLVSKSLSNK